MKIVKPLRKLIWARKGNPIPYVSRKLGIDPYVCSDTLHRIKGGARLGRGDDTKIYDNGDVANAVSDEDIGNLYDDA